MLAQYIISIVCLVLFAITLICYIVSEVNWSKKVKEQMQKYRDDLFDKRKYAVQDLGGSTRFMYIGIMLLFLAWGIFMLP